MGWISRRPFSVFSLVIFAAPVFLSAQTWDEAAGELAQKLGGVGAPTITVRSIATGHATSVTALRRALQSAFSTRPADAELIVTLSENLRGYLLVGELRRGGERKIAMVSLNRLPEPPVAEQPPHVKVEKKLVWEQQERILDIAFAGGELLVLDPLKVALYRQHEGRWVERQSVLLPAGRPWPRDMRGRLAWQGSSFRAYLPGAVCTGSTQPLSMDCKRGDAVWPVELGEAAFATDRNYFVKEGLPPFFAVARAQAGDQPAWVFAGLDGRAHLYDQALEPVAVFTGWGGDITGIATSCGDGHQVLATSDSGMYEADAVQAYEIVDGNAVAVSDSVRLPGPATALWPAKVQGSAIVVARSLDTGRYAAFILGISCGG